MADFEDSAVSERDLGRYKDILDLSSDITVVLDPEGRIEYVSDAVTEILGHDPADLRGMELREYVHAQDRAEVSEGRAKLDQADESETRFDARLRADDGSPVWFEVLFQNPPAEAFDGFLLTARRISEWKDRVAALETTKERMELALEGANLGIWDWDMETGEVRRDELLTDMLGYTLEEMGHHLDDWERLVHPEGKKRHDEALAEHIEERTPYYQCEYRLETASGSWKWVRTIGRVVEWGEDGTPLRAVGIHQDIDDRKRAQLELQDERDLFREGPAVVFKWRDEAGWPIEYVSENVAEVLGYSAAELQSDTRRFADLVHEDDLERLERELFETRRAGANQFNPEPYRVYRKDGTIRWVMEFTRVVDNGQVAHQLGYLVDITERKEREAKYRNLFEDSRDALMVFDREGYIDCNQRTLDLFGVDTVGNFLEYTPWELSPATQPDGRDSKPAALEYVETAFEEGQAFFEWTHERVDGEAFPSEVKLSRFEYEGETVLLALIRDITDRKQRARELEEREQKYRHLFEDTRDALMLLDREGFFDCNERTLELFGVESVEEFVGFTPGDLSPDAQPNGRDSNAAATDYIETAFAEGEAFFEWTHERRDGTTFPAEVKLSRFQLDGEPALHALVRDITERKAYEQELETLNKRFEFALEETDTGVWEWDVETDELVWDEASERLIGYEPGTFPGTFEDFADNIHDGDVEAVRAAIQQALQTDSELKTDFRVKTPQGEWKWVQVRGVVDYDDAGEPMRLIGIQTDITDRREREEAIRWERALNQRMQKVLADSRTRQVLENRITDQLHEHGYALAWVGEKLGGEIVPRAVGGGERYLDTIDRALDQDDTATEPSVTAALTGEAQYVPNVGAHEEHSWAQTATKYGYRSCAAIPIVYRDISWGILVLYHEETGRFGDSEQELLQELTDTIAFAIHSLETQDSLAADRTVAVTLQLTGGHYLSDLASDGAFRGADRVRVNGTVPVSKEEVIQYVEIEGETDTSIKEAVQAHSAVRETNVVIDTDPKRLQVTLTEPVPEAFLASRGVMVNGTVIETNSAQISLEFRQDADISETVSALETAFGSGSVQAVSERSQESAPGRYSQAAGPDLTDKQATALQAAYHNGYFDQPRRAKATEIAESLGITHSTFLQHLHRAEEKVFGAKFEDRTA